MLLAAWRLSRPSFAQAVSSLHPLLFFSHVVLPQDIAALLPKGKLLSEVRGRGRFMEGERAAEELPPPPCSLQAPPHFFFFFCRRRPPPRPALPPSLSHASSLSLSFQQAEWRGIGVQQSRGWVHYAIHRPEPHIMLYR